MGSIDRVPGVALHGVLLSRTHSPAARLPRRAGRPLLMTGATRPRMSRTPRTWARSCPAAVGSAHAARRLQVHAVDLGPLEGAGDVGLLADLAIELHLAAHRLPKAGDDQPPAPAGLIASNVECTARIKHHAPSSASWSCCSAL